MKSDPSLSQPATLYVCIGLVMMAWAGNALYAYGALDSAAKFWSPALVAGPMICFLVLHGRRTEGGRSIFIFVLTVFLIGWACETISLLTGFPFGNYHYTEVMAPFIGEVPVFVLPAYCVMGYISWSMARIVLGRIQPGSDAVIRFAAPVVAAMFMVLWDINMDPLRASVEGRWIWLDGGPHYGVPVLNFLGWFVVTWMMFQAYAVLRRNSTIQPEREYARMRLFWLTVPMMYLAFPVEYVLNPLISSDLARNVPINGIPVPLEAIYVEISILTVITMVPAALVAIVRVFWHPVSRQSAVETALVQRSRSLRN